jgi:hypothetical protein
VGALARAKEILEDDTRVFKKISCIALLRIQRMPSDDERQVGTPGSATQTAGIERESVVRTGGEGYPLEKHTPAMPAGRGYLS